jgi:hypothetical protein
MVIASHGAYSRAQELVSSRLIVGRYELTASATVRAPVRRSPLGRRSGHRAEHVRHWELN